MNYELSSKVSDFYISKGYDVKLNSSKSSDYLRITNSSDKYGFKLVVRFSDHDAMTSRSECADLQYITTEMFMGVWQGKFESKLGFDGDDFDTTGEFEYDTEKLREEAVYNVIIAEINNKLDF
jgi:hypothetical protein